MFILLLIGIASAATNNIAIPIIVHNEVEALPRLVESIETHLKQPHTWFICLNDGTGMGNDDGTLDWIKENMITNMSIAVNVYHDEWVDFSHNRNLCLRQVVPKPRFDYILLPDADFEFIPSSPLNEEELFDYNYIAYSGGSGFYYRQALLISTKHECSYHGVTHEFLYCNGNFTSGSYDGFTFKHHADGSNRENKLERDVRLLSDALFNSNNTKGHSQFLIENDKGLHARYRFYLARSLDDLGRHGEAIYHYRERITMGGWYEEVFYSQFRIGYCMMKLGEPLDRFAPELMNAYQLDPVRGPEPLYLLANAYRRAGKHHLCLLFAGPGHVMPFPGETRRLFLSPDVYTWRLKDELSLCLYYIGMKDESKRMMEEILLEQTELLPEADRERIERNIKMY